MNCSARLSERVRAVDPARVVPLLQPLAIGAAVVVGCVVLASVGGTSIRAKLGCDFSGLVARE